MVYCTSSEIESLLGAETLAAFIDDDESGAASAGETAYIADMIELAASEMDSYLCVRYNLADLSSSNTWLKWANAILAARNITRRRLSPMAPIEDQAQRILADLAEIRQGIKPIPNQAESFDGLPSVTNFVVERATYPGKIRVNPQESTRDAPPDELRRRTATWRPGYYG